MNRTTTIVTNIFGRTYKPTSRTVWKRVQLEVIANHLFFYMRRGHHRQNIIHQKSNILSLSYSTLPSYSISIETVNNQNEATFSVKHAGYGSCLAAHHCLDIDAHAVCRNDDHGETATTADQLVE